MKIYSTQGIELLDIQVDDSSVRYRSIMSDDSLTLKFSHTEPVTVPVGSYVNFEGQRYTLWLPENFKKHNTRNFEYTITLGGWREALKLFKFKDLSAVPYRLKFSLTAKPAGFLQLIVANMNIHDSGWAAGSCIDAVERTLSFNHEYCFDVLARIAQEWSTEFEFEGKKIHLRKVEKFKDAPLALSYGKGNGFKSGVGRANDGDKQPIGRLYVQGGERNIDFSTYGSSSLLLPKSQALIHDGKTYRTDAYGMFITRDGNDLIAEDSIDVSHIYPKRVGTVSEVVVVDAEKNFYDIKDASIPVSLDYSQCRIDGEKATISFQSGALAGREFDIEQTDKALTGYIHAERRFKIVPQELDGIVMPGGGFVPAVGDKYAIFNISMPDSYIEDNATKTGASWEMFEECVKYFAVNEKQKFNFTGELDGIWAKSQWLAIGGKIVPGGHVNFSDEQFLPDGEIIRIVSIKDYVNFPHKPEITLSNAPVTGGFGSTLGKLEAEEVVIEGNRKDGLLYSKRQWRDARETMALLEESLLKFSSGINPITVRTMQLLVGDESLQFRFVTNKTTPTQTSHNVTFDSGNKKLTAQAGIIQHMTLGITKITSTHKADEYKYWDMAAYLSPPLDAEKAYYLYAKCSKTTEAGTFLLSETAIELDGVPEFHHLLAAIVNSEVDGGRSIAPLYGFTEILPGRITTDKIVSNDGKTYFDLANNVIGGKIKFLNENNELEDVETVKLYIQYSVNGSSWHDVYNANDKYMRQKNGASGTWTGAIPIKGVNGDDGRGITEIRSAFAYSASDTSAPFGPWYWNISSLGTRPQGYFLWMRDDIFYTDGNSSSTVARLVVEGGGELDPELMAKINQSAAITDKFGTEVNGGLVQTVMMLLREANSEINTAGISGIQGAQQDAPAFWAGGSHADALAVTSFLRKIAAGTTPNLGEYAALAKIALLHSGAAKVGDLIVEESGRVSVVDPATGKSRLVFSAQDIPLLKDLLSANNFGSSTTAQNTFVYSDTGQQSIYLGGQLDVTKNGSEINITGGAALNLSGTFYDEYDTLSLSLDLMRDGVSYRNLEYYRAYRDYSYVNASIRSHKITSVPAGVYRLRLTIRKTTGNPTNGSGYVGNIPISWSFQQSGVRYFQFGIDGMMAFFSNNHIHFTETTGWDVRGKTNMPGVLASGTISTGGVLSNEWGAKVNYGQTITGGYRIFLKDMTHNKYSVQITPHTNVTFRVGTKTNTYFEILGTGAADFIVIGSNY